jgi:Sec-independent protein secretion pathway component TatC
MALAIPLLVLYEGAILSVRLVEKKAKKAEDAKAGQTGGGAESSTASDAS